MALIIADTDLCHWSFSSGIVSMGGCCITVHHPLEAIIGLQDGSLAIGVVLAPAHDPRFNALELFAFMRAEFPLVRRVAYAKHASEHADALDAGLLDVVLTYPTPLHELAEALQPASTRILPPAVVPHENDTRSDEQLFQAWKGADRPAFQELDRRYRPRIRQLATSMKFSDEDAEEIVQETLLGLFLGRETFRGHPTPDSVICGLTATSILARLRGEHRRTRLLSALAHAAVADRAARECSGQPDERLRATDLATHANAVICKLPSWCRRAFWLRAIESQSAREAGATLDMTPSTVDMWLLHVRRLIASRLRSQLA